MRIEERDRLARTGDSSNTAAGIRLVAGRVAAGLRQVDLSSQTGIKTNALSNMEKGRQFPSRAVMIHLFRSFGVDFNFLMYGDYSKLDPGLQDRIFDALQSLDSEPGPSPSSD